MANLLAANEEELRVRIAYRYGFSRDPLTWSDGEKAVIDDCITAGLRKFYWPRPDPMTGVSHVWSFMKQVKSLTTVADQWQYDLPSELMGIEGDITFVTTTTSYIPVRQVNEKVIRDFRQSATSATGIPRLFALRAKEHVQTKQQGFELLLSPTPDAAYEIEYLMNVAGRALTDAARFPFGGAIHADTIVESCLAVAERDIDRMEGPSAVEFERRLQASISIDSQMRQAPSILGINRDTSDGQDRYVRRRTDVGVLYNDVQY